MEQFFRDLDARGKYFGTGTKEEREVARRTTRTTPIRNAF
jgi:hypothetical protein